MHSHSLYHKRLYMSISQDILEYYNIQVFVCVPVGACWVDKNVALRERSYMARAGYSALPNVQSSKIKVQRFLQPVSGGILMRRCRMFVARCAELQCPRCDARLQEWGSLKFEVFFVYIRVYSWLNFPSTRRLKPTAWGERMSCMQ